MKAEFRIAVIVASSLLAVSSAPAQSNRCDRTCLEGTTAVRDRRILVTDAERGVVLAVAMIDNPGTGAANLPASQLVPGTYMVPELIKIDNGSISRVEGMVKWMPFGYASAWAEPTK
jgi:hypothetical protein